MTYEINGRSGRDGGNLPGERIGFGTVDARSDLNDFGHV